MHRPRRLRRSPALRNLVRETQLSAHDFILPLFVSEKLKQHRPIASMPGVFQFSLKQIVDEAQHAQDLGLQAVLLFGIPEHKDEQAMEIISMFLMTRPSSFSSKLPSPTRQQARTW